MKIRAITKTATTAINKVKPVAKKRKKAIAVTSKMKTVEAKSNTIDINEYNKQNGKEWKPLHNGVTNDVAKKTIDKVSSAYDKLFATLNSYLQPLFSTPTNPKNVLREEKGFYGRKKNLESLREKSASRDIDTQKGIFQMGDLLGFRIVLQDSLPKNVEKLLKQLKNAVKRGKLNITEIENYHTANGKSFATPSMLDELAKSCAQNHLKKAYDKSNPSGYAAIHLGIKTKEGYMGEIQIMNDAIEELKELDDIPYKLINNKSLKAPYTELGTKLKGVIDGLSKKQLDDYTQYRRDSFAKAFETKPKANRQKTHFIPIPYYLPKELGYQALANSKANIIAKEMSARFQ